MRVVEVWAGMRITMVYSASQAREVHVMRTLDGRRRRLVLAVGWRMTPAEIYQVAKPQLTDQEASELLEVLALVVETGADRH